MLFPRIAHYAHCWGQLILTYLIYRFKIDFQHLLNISFISFIHMFNTCAASFSYMGMRHNPPPQNDVEMGLAAEGR
jgi:hypothetical protein